MFNDKEVFCFDAVALDVITTGVWSSAEHDI